MFIVVHNATIPRLTYSYLMLTVAYSRQDREVFLKNTGSDRDVFCRSPQKYEIDQVQHNRRVIPGRFPFFSIHLGTLTKTCRHFTPFTPATKHASRQGSASINGVGHLAGVGSVISVSARGKPHIASARLNATSVLRRGRFAPLIAVEVKSFCAACPLERRVVHQFLHIRTEMTTFREAKPTIMN